MTALKVTSLQPWDSAGSHQRHPYDYISLRFKSKAHDKCTNNGENVSRSNRDSFSASKKLVIAYVNTLPQFSARKLSIIYPVRLQRRSGAREVSAASALTINPSISALPLAHHLRTLMGWPSASVPRPSFVRCSNTNRIVKLEIDSCHWL